MTHCDANFLQLIGRRALAPCVFKFRNDGSMIILTLTFFSRYIYILGQHIICVHGQKQIEILKPTPNPAQREGLGVGQWTTTVIYFYQVTLAFAHSRLTTVTAILRVNRNFIYFTIKHSGCMPGFITDINSLRVMIKTKRRTRQACNG